MVSQPIDLLQDRWQKKTAGGDPVPLLMGQKEKEKKNRKWVVRSQRISNVGKTMTRKHITMCIGTRGSFHISTFHFV